MEVNHVTMNGEELINLMSDTVNEANLLYGESAHDKAGNPVTGKVIPYVPNRLDNSEFYVNQREIKGVFDQVGKGFVDRWVLVSGTVTVNDDKSLTLNGEISQRLAAPIGGDFVAQASAGEATYDDETQLFVLSANGETIRWASLTPGKLSLPFVKTNEAEEMTKCQYYLEIIPLSTMLRAYHANGVAGFSLASPKRVVPTVTVYSADGSEGYIDEPLTAKKIKIIGAQASKGAVINIISDAAFTVNQVYRGKFVVSAELN